MLMALLPSNGPALQTPLQGSGSGPQTASRPLALEWPSDPPNSHFQVSSSLPPSLPEPAILWTPALHPPGSHSQLSLASCISVCSAFLTAPEAILARRQPWLQHLPQPPSGVPCPLLITLALPLPRPHTHRARHPPSPVPPSQFAIQPTAT